MSSESSALRIAGVMTGTSCDGMDVSCLEVSLSDWRPLWNDSVPYPPALRKRVLTLQKPGTRAPTRVWLELDRDLGIWYGSTLKRIIAQQSLAPLVIANHGQTLAHFPAARNMGTTLQLGDPARIAVATGLTVVSNFRRGDMAAGGQGAPLAPLFHRLLARNLGGESGGVAIHNIGGISNLTYVSPDGETMAFDTGPGNIWIDAAAQVASRGKLKFDRDGKLALSAKPDLAAINKLLRHPYFRKPEPKSTGRDDFPIEMLLKASRKRDASLVATALTVTVESIAHAYESAVIAAGLPLRKIFVCGGGAKNPTLLAALRERMRQVKISALDEAGYDPSLVESQAFAFFGFLSLLGSPVGGPWTGAQSFGPPGEILPGQNWNEVLRVVAAMDAED